MTSKTKGSAGSTILLWALAFGVPWVSATSGCKKEKPVGMAAGHSLSGSTGKGAKGPMPCKDFCKVLLRCTPEGQEVQDPKAELTRCAQECEKTPPPSSQDGLILGALRDCAGRSGGDCGKFKDCSIAKMQAMADKLQPKQEDPSALYKILPGQSPGVGAARPLVTIVAFLDAQCHFCKKSIPVLDALLRKYPGELRVVLKAFPLGHGKVSNLAAEAGMALYRQKGPDAFWGFVKKVFAAENLTKTIVEDAALSMGADRTTLARTLDKGLYAKAVEQDQELGHRFGVDGTPAFFVNGRKYPGFMPEEEFSKVVEMARLQANKLLSSGVSLQNLYARIVEKGYDKVRYLDGPLPQPGELDPKAVFNVPVTDRMPQRGPSDALVTIVEFSDFQCPFCRRLAVTLDELVKWYPKDLRIVFRHMPLQFHPSAFIAAEASMAAFAQKGSAGFWAFHDRLFQNQDDLSLVAIERIAREVGLDIARFRKAMADHRFEPWIKKELAAGEHWGIQGTPQMFINGRPLSGAYPLEQLKNVVEERLKEAKKLVAQGVARSKVYETIVSKGHKDPLFVEGSGPAADQAPLHAPAPVPESSGAGRPPARRPRDLR